MSFRPVQEPVHLEIKDRQRLPPQNGQPNLQVPKLLPKVAQADSQEPKVRKRREMNQGRREMGNLNPNVRKQRQTPEWQPNLQS